MSQESYLYCFSNECMPGIFRIGMTKKDINVKLNEANEYKEWKPPMLYKIEVAKKVKDPEDKYEKLKKILNKYRINQIQNFYKISLEEIIDIFNLIEGKIWNEEKKEISLCRDMSKCFKDKQAIRHIIGTNVWIGYYDKYSNKIKYQDKRYNSPSGFSADHYNHARKDRNSNSNGWKECECEIDGRWTSIFSL